MRSLKNKTKISHRFLRLKLIHGRWYKLKVRNYFDDSVWIFKYYNQYKNDLWGEDKICHTEIAFNKECNGRILQFRPRGDYNYCAVCGIDDVLTIDEISHQDLKDILGEFIELVNI